MADVEKQASIQVCWSQIAAGCWFYWELCFYCSSIYPDLVISLSLFFH